MGAGGCEGSSRMLEPLLLQPLVGVFRFKRVRLGALPEPAEEEEARDHDANGNGRGLPDAADEQGQAGEQRDQGWPDRFGRNLVAMMRRGVEDGGDQYFALIGCQSHHAWSVLEIFPERLAAGDRWRIEKVVGLRRRGSGPLQR